MARTEVVTWTCDYDLAVIQDGQQVFRRVSVDGRRYRVSLCREHDRVLGGLLARVEASARQWRPRRTAQSRRRPAAIREWALGQGIEMKGGGRIANWVVAKYEAREQ